MNERASSVRFVQAVGSVASSSQQSGLSHTGLPPVTAEWFDARKEHLKSIQAQAQSHLDKVFVCPITNKRFQSEATYENHTRTKKFCMALKKLGLTETPEPKVIVKTRPQTEAADLGNAMTTFQRMSLQPATSSRARLDGSCEVSDDESDSGWQTDDGTQEAIVIEVSFLDSA